jgi:hypothetical protein
MKSTSGSSIGPAQAQLAALFSLLLLLAILPGCSDSADQTTRLKELETKVAALEAALARMPPPPAPRLGNIMGMIQVRHSKLWFAGEQANWPLAEFERHELEEDFEDLEKLPPPPGHPPFGPLAQLPKPAMTALKGAIKSADRAQFTAAYDALTASCNICHGAVGMPFNFIQRPESSPWSNQDFAPRRPGISSTPQPQLSPAGKQAAVK